MNYQKSYIQPFTTFGAPSRGKNEIWKWSHIKNKRPRLEGNGKTNTTAIFLLAMKNSKWNQIKSLTASVSNFCLYLQDRDINQFELQKISRPSGAGYFFAIQHRQLELTIYTPIYIIFDTFRALFGGNYLLLNFLNFL